MKNAADPKLSAADIVQAFQQPKAEETLQVMETVRLSALEGHEAMVQFGKNAAVTVGVTNFSGAPNFPGGRGNARQVQYRQVGTLVKLTAQSQADKVLLKLSYEVSRLEGGSPDGPEADAPDMSVIQFNTTLLLEPGKPTLVGGTSAESTNFLLVSVAE
jgi:type II secretory pathway component GspD/PulD (secretin)